MKLRNLMGAFLALAGLAVTPSAAFAKGDIMDIRCVDETGVMVFGTANQTDPFVCSPDHPLTIGDTLTIRVRMLVRNWEEVKASLKSGTPVAPWTWSFQKGLLASELQPPKLAIRVGSRTEGAVFVDSIFDEYGHLRESGVPLVWDEVGNPDSNYIYFTDFYFQYKVKAGDLGMPITLEKDSSGGFVLQNVDQTDAGRWCLIDTEGNVADFCFMPAIEEPSAWPNCGTSVRKQHFRTTDLSDEGAFVKTLEFGPADSEGTEWRDVYPGMDTSPHADPEITLNGSVAADDNVTVYVWTEEEDVAVPVGGVSTEVYPGYSRQVLAVTVKKGESSAKFKLAGAEGAAVGAETTIYLCAVKRFPEAGTAVFENTTVQRTVKVVKAPEPTVHIYIDGTESKKTVTADPDYIGYKARLTFKVVPKVDVPVTVTFDGSVKDDDDLDSLDAIFEANILRIANGDFGDNPIEQKKKSVTIPPETGTAEMNVYVLGTTAKTASKGIYFTPTGISPVDSGVKISEGGCTLQIKKGVPTIVAGDPMFTTEDGEGTITTVSGSEVTFAMSVEDTYKNLNDEETGYTFIWKSADGEEIDNDPAEGPGDIFLEDEVLTGSAKFYNLGTRELTLQVKAPDGSLSAPVKYTLIVSDSKKTTIAFTDPTRLVFCEGEETTLKLGLTQPYKGTSYIFLDGKEEDLAYVNSKYTTEGVLVEQGKTEVAFPCPIAFLDGTKGLTLNALLCTDQYDKSKKAKGFVSGTLSFTVTNKPPVVTSVTAAGQYLDSARKGQTLPREVPMGVKKTFTLTADDVPADLTNGLFATKWVIEGQTYEVFGDPSTNVVTHTFLNATPAGMSGEEIRVYLKDKDMMSYPSSPSFYFYVRVAAKPHLDLTTSAIGGTFNEDDTANASVTLTLSEPATAPILVKLTVQDTETGRFRLRLAEGSVTNAVDAAGNVQSNVYLVTIGEGVRVKNILASDMDGTNDTLAGLDLNAEVISEGVTTEGVPWKDFYTASETVTIRVRNVPPAVIRPNDTEVAFTNMNASANTPYTISYGATDVKADLGYETNGVPVGLMVDISVDGVSVLATNVTSSAVQTTQVTFDGEGSHVVVISFTDKDQESTYRELNFYVQPSKRLKLSAHGPAPALGSSGGYSSHYASAPGLGAGRVWAGETGPQKVANFIHSYSFTLATSAVDGWAYGYLADGKPDDGSLTPAPDKGINSTGGWEKGDVITPANAYNYTTQHPFGKLGYDNFVYGWACNNTESAKGSGDNATTATFVLNVARIGHMSIPLPKEEKDAKSYPEQSWEAIFSREFLKSDNCGDINLDGVPDLALSRYGLGIIDPNTQMVVAESTEGDLKDASTYNEDENDNPRGYAGESQLGDFLPTTASGLNGYEAFGITGLGSWDEPFTAVLEIRGVGETPNGAMPLNDAFATEFPDGTVNRLAFAEVESDVYYLDPNTNPTSTLSRVEYLAWQEFAAAQGIADPDDPASWRKDGRLVWSPERPTLPTKIDTDGDGFPDGYEYYYWYLAHVGYMDGSVHRHLTGRKYDPRNPGEGTVITSEQIESAMDPIVASGNLEQDTDNDGLPDILEMVIGTNPFDFDSDGDGLPDGWELCNVGNLDPLDPASHLDGKSDTVRNSDGDAMAITSYELEKTQKPVPFDIEHAKRTTFAVIDPNGDSDGVQWYAVKGAPEDVAVTATTNAASVWSFESEGRTFISTEKPVLTAKGRLGKTLARGVAYVSVKPEPVWTNGVIGQVEEPEGSGTMVDVEGPITNYVAAALYPVRLEVGAPVRMLFDEAIDGVVTTLAMDIGEKDANACWIYGRGTENALYGDVAKTAADYGCLALGRYLGAKAGAVVCAMPDDTRDVAFLHYLVYQEFGFDPRTAWKAKDPLAARWGNTIDGEAVEGITVVRQGGYTGAPSRTRDYANYDEFLVYSFFVNNGCDMSGTTRVIDKDAPALIRIWDAFTTNPQGPNEKLPEAKEGETQVKSYGRGENGADTDFDGVPDGWELYVMSGPKKKGAYVFAHPYAGFATGLNPATEMPESYFSPFLDFAKGTETSNQIYLGGQPNDDTLNEFKEFEGTDSIAYYAVAEKAGDQPFSTTVVHPATEPWTWFNKFFPTDPWNVDTDGDGLKDSEEKGAFAYGTPADDGKLWSIPGGGLNPCSVDTDLDGLPDGWENQYSKPADGAQRIYPDDAEPKPFRVKDATGAEIGNPLEGLVNCMDGTVPDAYNVVNGDESVESSGKTTWTLISSDGRRMSGHVNRDYDRDGLENWQEYLVGTMRCWRYDDPVSPWTFFDESVYFDEYGLFDAVRSAEILGIGGADDDEKAAAFWYETLVNSQGQFYNPHFVTGMSPAAQYFSRVTNAWDAAYLDATLSNGKFDGAYYYFKDRIGGNLIKDTWGKILPLPDGSRTAPNKYISCSPVDYDTDCDGMDDYYELFHGLNPLLGKSGVKTDSGNACDIVFDAWYNKSALEAFGTGETKNYWQRNPWKAPRGENGMDFEVFPYLNGLQNADPDGDDVFNNVEFLQTRMKDIGSHTDPTPLWMTDSTYSNSLVSLHYRIPTRSAAIVPVGEGFSYNDVTYKFSQFDGWGPVGLVMGYMPFNLDSFWSVAANDKSNWMFSFEENEGFDTDHDALGDREERTGLYRSATDPLDADSPRRRQAMYFPGENAALQTMPELREEYPVGTRIWPTDPSFLNFTVECWVKPEDLARDQTVIERAVWIDPSNAGDQEYLRKNFQLALRGGRWFAKYDSGALTNDEVKAFSRDAAEMKWTHLAATFDGSAFRFYVDGICQNEDSCGVETLPEYGSSAMSFVKGTGAEAKKRPGDYAWDSKYDYKAILVGASFKGASEGGKAEALDVTSGAGWSCYRDFFKGYVDEIRIWDGARTGGEIAGVNGDMKKRYTAADAKANRDDFYDQWAAGQFRYEKATTVRVIPELRYHFHFDSVPGAADADSVMKAPTGFQTAGGKPVISRPVGYAIDWFAKVVDAYGTVYGPDCDWVQWIPNTVAHLPRFDGTTLDSFFWSKDYSGANPDSNAFENSAEPVSRWTQMAYNGVDKSSSYQTTAARHHLIYETSNSTSAVSRYQFTGRHLNQAGDDLLPLGGAFVKYAEDLWDGAENGPTTQWEHTGIDSDGNMIPDWYEEYIRKTYGLEGGIGPDMDIFVPQYGRTMKVRELYLIDLAGGVVRTADGKSGEIDPKRAQIEDIDKDGIPDWWEVAYRIHTKDTDPTVGHADGDPDNDGLSNYQEYLVSQGAFPYGADNGFPNLNPMGRRSLDAISGFRQVVSDYFLPLDAFPITLSEEDQRKYFYLTEYLGGIFTDHDFVEDWWENKYAKDYTSAKVYDPWDDTDGDGWSTFAECRASLWGHSFLASLIDGWTGLSSDMHVTDYPEPIIGVKVSYAGQNKVSGSQLVIRTKTGQTKRTDATFVIPSTLDSQTRYLNMFEGGEIFHGHLSPGQINPNSVVFEYARYSSDKIYQWNCDWYKENEPEQIGWDYGRIAGEYYEGWWTWSQSSRIHTGDFAKYRDEIRRWPHLELEGGDLQWEAFAETQQRGNDAVDVLMNGKPIGTIDATTGEFALDMTRFAMTADYREYVFRVTYTSRIGHEWPQTVYVSDTKELASGTGLYGLGSGRVREGQNTIEAFFDFNRNGQYDVGEPYGAVKNVQVGWHKVPEVTIELTDESKIADGLRKAIVAADKGGSADKGSDGAAAQGGDADKTAVTSAQKVRIVRESINGQTEFGDLCLNERTLMKRDFLMDDRAYVTEADVVSAKKPDLDWNYLRKDAATCGILSIDYATYRVESFAEMPDGTVSNTVIGTFTREFRAIRPATAAVSPTAEHPVYSSAPTFRFTADEDATAFEIQVAKESDGTIVYDSGIQMLGGRSATSLGSLTYSFTAPIYAGVPAVTNGAPVLVDGETYKWRVVAYNAKFNTAAETDFSDWATFQMDVGNRNRYPLQPTGYGRVGAIVRYFGPAKTNTNVIANQIIVEAFATADFTGQAMAQTRVDDTGDLSSPTAPIDTLDSVNALLTGVDTGTVYLRAYIDLNNNGQWDRFEPWGYANMFDEYGTEFVNPPIYNPKGIAVGSSMSNILTPNFTVLYIEDTDWNKNEIPDCTEDIDDQSIWPLPPVDPETSFEDEDSDHGGAPDDWEEGAGTNWEDPEDEQTVVLGDDVMAYEDIPDMLLVQIGADENDRAAAWYAVMDLAGEGTKLRDGDMTKQTDASEIKSLVTTWSMTAFNPVVQGTESYVGIGTNVTFRPGEAKVLNKAHTTVRLVHAQVYAKNGYNTLTANGPAHLAGKAVNTKPFTVFDKYLVCRYLENIGVEGVSEKGMIDEVRQAKRRTWDAEDENWDINETWKVWSRYTLDPNSIDSDRDDIADGWELYTMFGTVDKLGIVDATSRSKTDLAISPFNTADGKLVAPGTGSQLKLVEEFDGGYYPTDPWSVDTDHDNVIDWYAYQYHLKGDDAGKDLDGDGLSNYAEYLVSEVFQYAECDPERYATNDGVCDYFKKVGDLYLGEIFTDHDQVGDEWEDAYPAAANRYVYDPDRDDDNDGWSNYAEFRAGTDPTKVTALGVSGSDGKIYTKNEYPIPVIEAKVVYNGHDVNLGSIVFKAWNDAKDPGMLSAPDAVWTIGNGKAAEGGGSDTGAPSTETGSTAVTPVKYIGRKPSGVQTYRLSGGSIESGSITVKFLDQQFVRYDSNDVAVAHNATSPKDANWYAGVWDKNGKLYDYRDREVGSVNYDTGLLTLDCGKLTGSALGLPNSTDGDTAKLIADKKTAGNTGGQYYDTISLDNANLLISWGAVNVKLTAEGTYYLADADGVNTDAKSHGHVREGLTTFTCFSDENADGKYTAGEPFGIVRGVDVGWQGAKFTVELTEASPVFARVNLYDGTSDRRTFWGVESGDIDGNTFSNTWNDAMWGPAQNQYEHIRIVPYAIAGTKTDTALYDRGYVELVTLITNRVVAEFDVNADTKPFLSEGDFIRDGQFDIYWNGFDSNDFMGHSKVTTAVGDVTAVKYRIVFGKEGPVGRENNLDTTTVVRAFSTLIERRYEHNRTLPSGLRMDGIAYGARPIFRWRLDEPTALDGYASSASLFGCTYTAFQIQVADQSGTVIYDSGLVRTPAKNANGEFEWTPELYAGDQTSLGKVFAKAGNWKWRVAMYNAKFRPLPAVLETKNGWSAYAEFSTSVDTQQEIDDHSYSAVDVAVKYAGPIEVLKDCENLAKTEGKVRIQAFTSADFSGEPVAQGFVTDKTAIANAVDVTANGRLIGLPEGTYYIRAYIDSNGNFVKDDFESWGYAKEPVIVPDASRLAGAVTPVPAVWIEDADTDQDWLPDAWEYAKYGNLATEGAKIDPEGKIVLKKTVYDGLLAATAKANFSQNRSGASLTFFQNIGNATLLLGLKDVDVTQAGIADIRAAVEKKIEEGSVKITSLVVDATSGKVILTVGARTTDSIAGYMFSPVYEIPTSTDVTIKIYKKENLATDDWKLEKTVKKTIKSTMSEEVEVNTGVNFNSGFFKVEVVK